MGSSVANAKVKKIIKKRKALDGDRDDSENGVNDEEDDSGSEYRG